MSTVSINAMLSLTLKTSKITTSGGETGCITPKPGVTIHTCLVVYATLSDEDNVDKVYIDEPYELLRRSIDKL